MEQHKNKLIIDENYKPSMDDSFILYFNKALAFTQTNYADELNRISNTKFETITANTFFKEFCWCVYTSGFNAKIVSKFYYQVMLIYKDLSALATGINIVPDIEKITIEALKFCNNKRKVAAIVKTANILNRGIQQFTWETYKQNYLSTPEKLQALPFIGPITCYHLARNIGLLEHVKPDLHLVRMAEHWGFSDPLALCNEIKKYFIFPLGIIDLILWYGASTFGTKIKNP